EKLDKSVSTLLVDYPLSRIENKNQVVQKFFKLENYSPSQMGQVIEPLLTESGYVSADESTRSLLVIDTVENLMRIEMIIAQFDVPEAEQTVTEIFEILYSDPSEIVQLLRMLISGESGTSSRSLGRSSSYDRSSSSSRYDRSRSSSRYGYGSSSYRSGVRPASSTSVIIGPSQLPVVLIPEPKRKWIIARASAEDMKRIGEWIEKLDQEEPVKSEHEAISITYADVREVADRLNEALQQMPGTELQASVLIQPLENARQIVIFGRADMREMVKKLIIEIDIPTGQFETRVFKLKHADSDQIKENIDNLYSEMVPSGSASYYYYRYGRSQRSSADEVKVISFPTMQQVTVIATPDNMLKITEQIVEWDVPLNVDEVKPRIIELHNSDPVEMADLLTTLFTEETGGRGLSIYDILFGRGTEEKAKIVGPLYGQLTFEDVPRTKKIIVISKIPEAYDVVEALIRDLDKQEMAEVPRVVQLKYADPEDLSERLNAMFNEAGTSARIRVSARGLGDYSMEEEETQGTQQSSSATRTSSTSTGQSAEGTYTPWWSGSGARSRIDEEMPISNVIGKIRFVPDPHSKSILVLAPVGFIDRIEELINELDVPGKQVMIKAVIVEVDHKSMTSLGLQLASDPTTFGTLGENAITSLNTLTHMATHGSLSPSAATTIGATGTGTVLGTGADVFALIDFLIKRVNAKILNQQTLWTKDNEEASFFKGQRVAFQTQMGVTQQTTTQSYEYEKVGMTLAARPSITPEKNVDMVVNVLLSQLTSDQINNQPVRSLMETETNMIVKDGQTIMLGGILFQTDSFIERKLPLLGDIPLAGGLFRHNETLLANNELIVFITPFVIDEPGEMLPETLKEIEGPRQKLEDVKEQLEQMKRRLEPEAPQEQQESKILEAEPEKTQKKREPATKEPKKIDDQLKQPEEEIGEIYSCSIDFYCDGQLEKAREGFVQVLQSDLAPAVVKETVEAYLMQIDSILAQRGLFAQASYSPKH
ncbi:MAG: secretin N-terminal domain-containing protein, partial [Phycisphaerae bacterium]